MTIFYKLYPFNNSIYLGLNKFNRLGFELTGTAEDITADINRISFNYGKRSIFEDFSLIIPKGISLGLLGGNGSGKTTLMKLISGLEKVKKGNIKLFDNNLTNSIRAKIGYMPQQNALYNDLTVFDNVDFFARMYGIQKKSQRSEAVNTALKTVDLSDRKKDTISTLSGGMERRVSLACVLVHKPEFLLLDEPTVGLDPDIRITFWDYFKKLTDEGTTLFITSHTMDDAMHCDRLIFLKNGRIIAEDTPKALMSATGNPNSTLEDSFLYFNAKESSDDIN